MRLGLRKLSVAVAVAAALGMAVPMVATTTANAVDTPASAADTQEQTTWNWVNDFTSFGAAAGDNATWHAQWRGGSGVWTDFEVNNGKAEASDDAYRYWYVNGAGATKDGPVGFETVGAVKRGVISVGSNGVDGAVTWKAPKAGTVWVSLGDGEPYRAAAGGSITFGLQLVKSNKTDFYTLKMSTLTDTTPVAGWNSPIPVTVEKGDYLRLLSETSNGIADGRVYASPTVTYDAPDSYSFVDELSQTFLEEVASRTPNNTWSVEQQTGDDSWEKVTQRGTAGSQTAPNAAYYYNTWYGSGINVRVASLTASNRNALTGILNDDVATTGKGAALVWTAPKAGKVTIGVRNDEPYRQSASHTGPVVLTLQKGDDSALCTATLAGGSTARSDEFANCLQSSKGVIDVQAGDKVRIIANADGANHGDVIISPIVSYLTEDTNAGTYSAKVANVTDYRGDKVSGSTGTTAASFTAPAAPAGYTFAGWYADSELTTPLDSAKKSGVAYAKFVKTEDVIKFQGGSLRVGKYTTSDGTDDYSKTDLRFGYHVDVPDGATFDKATSGWRYGTASVDLSALNYRTKVAATKEENGKLAVNLIFTGITSANYARNLYVAAFMGYTTADGTPVVASETEVRSSSVQSVATAIQSSSSASAEEKAYAAGILQQISSESAN
ncbi:InlB B-repeat-containing protein [Bifidobacterium leontopitheci]|uniref:Uncharacterized protein n=1 Tax=Bifidobacterium leontopitheci TaxID=2650774 RepID=A0A6I1GJD0_9BIFI|nr:InlB B-repeat-containing protein [Bifidobacterium leontopitheci]KAB7789509.1 hypothetical protein F7D09_1978 [Bifidobacterium leontopitheci]